MTNRELKILDATLSFRLYSVSRPNFQDEIDIFVNLSTYYVWITTLVVVRQVASFFKVVRVLYTVVFRRLRSCRSRLLEIHWKERALRCLIELAV